MITNFTFLYRRQSFTARSLVFRLCDQRANLTSKDWGKMLSTSACSLSFATSCPASLSSRPMFSLSFLFLSMYLQKPLHTPRYFQLQLKFGFPNSIPASSGNVTVFLLGSLALLLPSLYSLSVFELSQEFPVHPRWPFWHLLNFLHIGMDHPCALKQFWKINQLSRLLCPSRKFSIGSW